jgi:hypothetical protein
VVLALPESSKLVELFVDLGVRNVVHFHFPTNLSTTSFMDMVIRFPRRFKKIYLILERFYANLIKEYHIDDALSEALYDFEVSEPNRILDENRDYYGKEEQEEMEYEHSLHQCDALIAPAHRNHHKKLFDSLSTQKKKRLDDGPYLDSSKKRGPTNIFANNLRPTTPFTGRHIEMFKAATFIKTKDRKLLNIYGPSGIGKTRFVIETAYFLHARHNFTDGIFYFDLKKENVRSIDQLT